MKSIFSSITRWYDQHGLLLYSAFLLLFIPLYPKIPLFSLIEQYIVRVRFEDILVALACFLWLIQWKRGLILLKLSVSKFILAYVVVSALSVLSAIFIIGTVPLESIHLEKTILHFLRYIEYFSLFVIIATSVKQKSHIYLLSGVVALTVVAAAIYGYGQRHYYWPVYSTMNREFSKGIVLYLTEHARVQSTFGGHYDLGGYLVITLPIIVAIGLATHKKWLRITMFIIHILGLWLLVVSAARSSFIGYLIGLEIVILLFSLLKPTLKTKLTYFVSRSIIAGLVVIITFSAFGEDIYERFLQLLKANPELHQQYHAWNKVRKEKIAVVQTGVMDTWPFSLITIPEPQKPENAISTEEAQSIVLQSDTRPSPVRPADVYVDIPDKVIISTTSATGVVTTTTVERDRTFSDNALKYGLSLAIRLDTTWPQAIAGFKRNMLFGSGYATLNKNGPYDFTEADSTDNNFLRTLGETGLLGFITYYGAVVAAMMLAAKYMRSSEPIPKALAIGYIGAAVGLLINATYIDVFASSKVAFTFWGITGILASLPLMSTEVSQSDSSSSLAIALDKKLSPLQPKTTKSSKSKKKKSRSKK